MKLAMADKSLGQVFLDKMKYMCGHMEYCGTKVGSFVSGDDEDGVIRHPGIWLDENGVQIKDDNKISIFDKKKFFNKYGVEIDEPRIVFPCNVIYGPQT